MGLAIGFDIGGTFTDFAMFDADTGQWYFTKIRTTPEDRSTACVEGVQSLLDEVNRNARSVEYVAHGSTVVTNTLIERKGARTALITTEGFRDILEIRRQIMPNRYDVRVPKPEPFVSRSLRIEVRERVLADGIVEAELDEDELQSLLGRLKAKGVESIAISFLHSYANPVNEKRAHAVASRAGDWYVCSSHNVLNEFREYERTSTAVANAYVAPPVRRYLDRLETRLREEIGVGAPLLIFQSNGGVAPTAQARDLPIASVLSGPAAGVVAACAVGSRMGMKDFVSIDMGGTSCDVALIKDGVPRRAYEQEIAGWAVRTPRLDIHSVGAGGGSIAWIDQGGLLRVGPHSAGAYPGPACYGQGGTDPTVTDANLVLGRLNATSLLGGRMVLRPDNAAEAVRALGARIALGLEAAAMGIIDVVNSTMAVAIRVVSVERGHDPRDFALLAFGGAGPLHACDLASEAGIRTVVVPPYPGVLCALGLLVSDLRVDASLSRRLRLGETTPHALREIFTQVEKGLRESPSVRSRPASLWRREFSVDMRYLGQSFELRVPVKEEMLAADGLGLLSDTFDAEHARVYGFSVTAEKEITCFRVALEAPAGLGADRIPQFPTAGTRKLSWRPVYFKNIGWVKQCTVYQRASLEVGNSIKGPAVIEEMDSTVLVTPGFTANVDVRTNLVLVHE